MPSRRLVEKAGVEVCKHILLAWYDSYLDEFNIATLEKLAKSKVRRKGKELTVGRSYKSSICLYHPTVSRNHCQLQEQGGRLSLLDLSAEGTCLLEGNGQFVHMAQSESSIMPASGALRLGNQLISFFPKLQSPQTKVGITLKCIEGAQLKGKTWALPVKWPQEFEFKIGSGSSSDCKIDHESVSPHHCSIVQKTDDSNWAGIYILESKHYTCLNGLHEMAADAPYAVLFPGAQVSIALSGYTFEVLVSCLSHEHQAGPYT